MTKRVKKLLSILALLMVIPLLKHLLLYNPSSPFCVIPADINNSAIEPEEIHKSPVTTPHSDKVVLHPQHAEFTTELHSAERSPEDDLAVVQELLRLHRQAHRENPVGLNDEITAALLGQNAKNYALLPRNSPFLSQEFHPQLLDRWGTPYRFHALSAKEMEVSSAGPDKAHHTQDDLTLSP